MAAHFDATPLEHLAASPSFNVAPTDPVLAVAVDRSGSRQLGQFRWGLIPSWTKPPTRPGALPSGAGMINARAETIATKTAFRSAFARRRCIVPVDGFYEWQRHSDGKQPWYIHRRDGSPLALAGIWESWQSPEPGSMRVKTCAIVTTTANALMADVHDRMPVIFERGDLASWLDLEVRDVDALATLLRPAGEDVLERHPVSTAVNHVANNDPSLVEPIRAAPPLVRDPGRPERAVPLTLL